jgi:hypothetical protein
MSLKPRNVIQAAEADLARRLRNIRRDQGGWMGQDGDSFEHYAFYAPHVRRALNARHLIELALKAPAGAFKSKKKNTLLIYGDAELLARALELSGT